MDVRSSSSIKARKVEMPVDILLLISGIGCQGIQLLSKTLAQAAVAEGQLVMLSSEYGSETRSGSSRAAIAIGPSAPEARPALASANAAIALHQLQWKRTAEQLRGGALVLADENVAGKLPSATIDLRIIAANRLAEEAGNAMAANLVMAAAFAAMTRAVSLESLIEAMRALIPPDRAGYIAANEKAMRLGHETGRLMEIRQLAFT